MCYLGKRISYSSRKIAWMGDPFIVSVFKEVLSFDFLLSNDQISVVPFVIIQLRLEPLTELLSAQLSHILAAHVVLLAAQLVYY